MTKWLKRLFCKHELVGSLVVSGYGYTQYTLRFCTKCEILHWTQTHSNND